MTRGKRIAEGALIVVFWLGVWFLVAWGVGKPLLLPTPTAVLGRLWELIWTADFYAVTAYSLGRVLSGILVSILAAALLSALTSRLPLLKRMLQPLMTVVKATPVASFIVLAVIWLGSERVTSFVTLLIVLPVVWTNLDQGFAEIDPRLDEVTRVYRFSYWRRLRVLVLPSLRPYFVSACRTSFGLALKAGIAAEIIALPKQSIGTKIFESKQYIMAEDTFAWTLLVILISLCIEALFGLLMKRLDRRGLKKEDTYAEI